MLLVNGHIRLVEDRGGFDGEGNPVIEADAANPGGCCVSGKCMPCNFVRSSYNGKGYYEDGQFYHGSYTVLVECPHVRPGRVELYDLMGNKLGDYDMRINGIVRLHSVGLTQITL